MEGTDEERSGFFSSVLSWFSSLFESLGLVKDSITQGLSFINPFNENFILKNLLDWLNPTSEEFILKQLWEFLTNIVSYLNPFHENFLGRKLVELIGNLLSDLFVPEEDIFGNLQENIRNKFYFTTQIQEIFESLLSDFDYGDSVPSFSITYYGKTVNIIDFSPYLEYRSWLHAIILGISWFVFIRKTFYKIPGIIGGI